MASEKYQTTFDIPEKELSIKPIVIYVKRGGHKLGRIEISKTKISWFAPNKKTPANWSKGWDEFIADIKKSQEK